MKKNIKITVCLFVLIITVTISGCNGNKQDQIQNDQSVSNNNMEDIDNDKNYITLYYKDADNLLIPISREVSEITGIANAALNALKDTSVIREDIGRINLYPTLPKELNINGINIENKVAYVDVDENILSYQSEIDEKIIIDSMVYTLTEFETIEIVQLLINGQKYDTLRFGYPISQPFLRVGINNLKDTDNNLIQFYFVKSIGNQNLTCYVPISLPIKNGVTSINNFFATLQDIDVEQYNLKSYIPKDLEVNSFKHKEDTLYLDIPSENLKLLDCFSDERAYMQIAYSLKDLFQINEIILTVDGKKPVINGEESNYTYKVPNKINKM